MLNIGIDGDYVDYMVAFFGEANMDKGDLNSSWTIFKRATQYLS